MELTGRIDEHGRVWLPITVRGNRGETTLEAVVDLGFTETMVLPIEIAAPLGLELTSSIPLELADGRIQTFFLFAATVVVGDMEVPVDIIVTERGTPLIGTALLQTLEGHLSVRFADGSVSLSVPTS
jgi:predicted aspartyl protease